MSIFTINQKSPKSKARTGILSINSTEIKTPAFMPIGTQGSVKAVSNSELLALNYKLILGNTYHLWVNPDLEVVLNFAGYHNFIDWKDLVLTDSGGFQAFSLSKIRKFTEQGVTFKLVHSGEKRLLTPEYSMFIQSVIGSNIALVLDECLAAEVTESEAKRAMYRTARWAERSKIEFENLKSGDYFAEKLDDYLNKILEKRNLENLQKELFDLESFNFKKSLNTDLVLFGKTKSQSTDELKISLKSGLISNFLEKQKFNQRYLFAIPQGAQFINLRKESAKITMDMDFPGYSVGGVANGGEPEEIMYSQVLSQTEILEEYKPKHLLGVGTPKDIVQMVARGIDLFDCVYPTRLARHGSVFFRLDEYSYETVHLNSAKYKFNQEVINSDSIFPELRQYSKGYLCHLLRVNETLGYRLATLHNLEFYADLMQEIRQKINNQSFDSWWPKFGSKK